MTEEDQEILDAIFRVRVRNNDPWKKIVVIALRNAPEETRAVLREINTNDLTISSLMLELGHK